MFSAYRRDERLQGGPKIGSFNSWRTKEVLETFITLEFDEFLHALLLMIKTQMWIDALRNVIG